MSPVIPSQLLDSVKKPSRILCCAFAVLSVAIALLLMLLLDRFIDITNSPFLVFFAAIILSALYGGLEAGVLATGLSAVVSAYFFIAPLIPMQPLWQEGIRGLIFILEGIYISALIEQRQIARRRTEGNLRKLKQQDEQLTLAMNAAAMGTWDWNLRTGEVIWSRHHERLFGVSPGNFTGTYEGFLSRVHPDDRESSQQAVNRALTEKIEYNHDFRVIWPDGSIHWISAKGQFFYDENEQPIRMLGVCIDISDRKQFEESLQAANRKIQNILESITDGFISLDQNWCYTYINPKAEEFLQKKREDLLNRSLLEIFPDFANSYSYQQFSKAIQEQQTIVYENFDSILKKWLLVRLYPSPEGLSIYFQDIGEQKQNEKILNFLFEASNVLASSLDYETTLTSVVNLAVPQMADWSAIDLLDESGAIKRLAVAHVDPSKVELAYELYHRYPPDPEGNDLAISVLRSGQAQLLTDIPDSLLVESAHDPEHLAILRELNLKSAIAVPLTARGRTLGVIAFVWAESNKHYQSSDLEIAIELGRRAALAIDNARLYREAQEAERSKDESLALLDTLLESAPVGLAFFDPQLRCVRINHYVSAINGVSIAESIGRTLGEYLPEFANIVEPLLQQVLATGEPILNVEIAGETKATVGQQYALANYYPVYSQQQQLLGVGVAVSDITHLKQVTQLLQTQAEALQKQQEWLEYILNFLPIPLLFIEPGTARVTFANRAADELAGGEFPKGKSSAEYHTVYYCTDRDGNRIPDEQMPGVRVAHGERLEGFEMDWHTAQGIRSLLIFGYTLPEIYGHPATGVVLFQDITNLKEAEQVLRQQAEELSRTNRMKDEFLAVVSHELRSPLNAILGWAQMLLGRKLSESVTTRALETIERNARAQKQLIEDLLDVSRIITGKLRLNVRSLELVPIIEAAVDSVRPAAEAKQIRLQAILDPATGLVSGDSDRLQQVVWNLLSNAIKFTPKGGRVQVRLERINSHLEIIVTDTGIGIPAEFLPFVFERFRQADSTSTRSHGGLGLGLAIVRHLVELHGGSVQVESLGEGQGSIFTVLLPLIPVRLSTQELERFHPTVSFGMPFQDLPALNGVSVLVVDDEPDAREFLKAVLITCGAQVRTAASATAALEAIQASKPDVLVSDIGMPEIDGYTLIRQVRSLAADAGGQIPAAALTAYARPEDRTQALKAGFQIHLPKPVEPAELATVVASLARRLP